MERLLPLLLLVLMVQAARASDAADLEVNEHHLQLASVHAAVVDAETGELLYAKYADRQVPVASITKLMTALVVLDSGEPLDEWLTIVERREKPPVNAWSRIRIGSELKRSDLLRITLMASENLAAYVLGRHHPGGMDAFIEDMNRKARELGMTRTRFVDPAGLYSENRSTARDLVKLMEEAGKREEIVEYTTTGRFTARFRSPRYQLGYGNTNLLVHRRNWDVTLSKSGYLNDAGRCLVMQARVNERPVTMVLLDSFGRRTPIGDAARIRRWIETGRGGAVAGPALEYERRQAAQYETEQTRTADGGPN